MIKQIFLISTAKLVRNKKNMLLNKKTMTKIFKIFLVVELKKMRI